MIVGCFALVEPFASMERQFHAIREMGIEYADVIRPRSARWPRKPA